MRNMKYTWPWYSFSFDAENCRLYSYDCVSSDSHISFFRERKVSMDTPVSDYVRICQQTNIGLAL